MPADKYDKSLSGLGLNFLLVDIEIAVAYQTESLGAKVIYSDLDITILEAKCSNWIFHADRIQNNHPLSGRLQPKLARSIAAEIRLHGCNPDDAEAKVRKRGDPVLTGTMDKPHGLREVYLIDPDGYIWVPDVTVKI